MELKNFLGFVEKNNQGVRVIYREDFAKLLIGSLLVGYVVGS